MKEIERKFLVKNDQFKKEAHHSYKIKQAYLQKNPEKSIRVRLTGNQAWITIKGVSDQQGLVRNEWEYVIPPSDAQELISLCENAIEKTRYEVKHQAQLFEIDVFHGKNEGLVVTEIELEKESNQVKKPDWLGEEITGIIKYYNLALLDFPFEKW
jgi:adenylate cyclase